MNVFVVESVDLRNEEVIVVYFRRWTAQSLD